MICREQHRTRAGLVDASTRALKELVESHGSACLVVPSHAWAQQRKLLLSATVSTGVAVTTHAQFVEKMWEVFGDGSLPVANQQRRMLVRTIAEQLKLFSFDASTKFVDELARFTADACAGDMDLAAELSPTESQVMELVSLYERELELKGLVELSQIYKRLDARAYAGKAVVYENPQLRAVPEQNFLERLGKVAHVRVCEQVIAPGEQAPEDTELAAVQKMLFSGAGGLKARGALVPAQAAGHHAQAALLVKRVKELLAQGARPSDIVIALKSTSDAYPALHDALAEAGVPFATEFSLPVARTGLGGAFCELAAFEKDPKGPESYERLSSVLAGPYSGVRGQDARAVQAWWRARAGSTPEQRAADIADGFTPGAATSTFVRERLEPFAQLLKASLDERVRLMFAHAHEAHLDARALVDDRAVAEVILDYLEQCDALGAVANVDDIGNEPVVLARGFRQDDGPLAIVGASAVGLAAVPHLIMGNLDTAHYPMSAPSSALDSLRAKLGLLPEDTTAHDARLLLLNLVEAAAETFTCARSPHDALAEENCASALWDELMAVYRDETENDPEHPLASDKIPAALQGFACQTSEHDVFLSGADDALPHVVVERGVVGLDAREVLTKRAGAADWTFSPTQIEDYYRCPYRWFTSRRVGYSTLDREFDQSALGTLFHDAMARFYPLLKEAGHARVTRENLQDALRIAERAFSEQLEASKRDARKAVFVRTPQDELRIEELHEAFVEFVKRDASFLPSFTPTYFELSLGGNTTGPLEYGGVAVRGKVDRIDIDDAGRAVIIDYKLSGLSAGYGLETDADNLAFNRHVQTDIYAAVVQRYFEQIGEPVTVVGSVYRSYRKNALRGAYAAALDWGDVEGCVPKKDALPLSGSPEGYSEYIVRVERNIAARLARLEDGCIAADPIDDDACAYCLALPFCPAKEAV